MRHSLLAIIFFLTTGFVSHAQYTVSSKYFVYLQTEPAQPFYIRINGQQLSANASGYLILPQLKDGDYKLVVGFPQEKYAQQTYNFTIDSKDKGYLIKDFGAEGWGLFDLQTMVIQKPLSASEAKAITNNAPTQKPAPPITQSDPVLKEDVSDFTKVLSKAANDPGLLEKPEPEVVVAEKKEMVVEEQKPQPLQKEEGASVAVTPQVTEKAVEQPQQVNIQPATPAIQQNSAANNIPTGQSGGMLVYENRNEAGIPEPVTIFITEPKNVLQLVEKKPEPEVSSAPVEATPLISEEHVEQQKEQDIITATSDVAEKAVISEEKRQSELVDAIKPGINCKRVANEDDFLKLRRQMSQKDNDESMISQAKSAFKSKCYTTAQVKYLSSMFLSNAGKYNFYEAARPFIADQENFVTLRSEIKDDYYLGKFDALTGQK